MTGRREAGVAIRDEYARRLRVWSDIQDHLVYLHRAVLDRENCRVFELGVREGFSTSAFLSAAQAVDGHVWSVDLNPPDVPPFWFEHPAWSVFRGDSVAPETLSWFPPQCDVLFIDTSHSYIQTLAELYAFVPRVSGGGVALLHDTQWLPPDRSLLAPGGPVTDALNTFCAAEGHTWTPRLSRPGFYGLGVINVS